MDVSSGSLTRASIVLIEKYCMEDDAGEDEFGRKVK